MKLSWNVFLQNRNSICVFPLAKTRYSQHFIHRDKLIFSLVSPKTTNFSRISYARSLDDIFTRRSKAVSFSTKTKQPNDVWNQTVGVSLVPAAAVIPEIRTHILTAGTHILLRKMSQHQFHK